MKNPGHTTALSSLLFGALSLLGACDTQEELLSDDDADIEANEAADEDDEFRAWLGYSSEEDPPLICPNRYAVRGFACWGSYCDNVAINCRYVSGASFGESQWLRYFSEEGSGLADEGHCEDSDSWMTGLTCSGSYCDNISLRCTEFPGTTTGNCQWSNWRSEEQAPFYAPYGHYIKGIECDGSYCDNKRFRYCRMQ